MKLFGIGSTAEKKKAKALPPMLAQLFSGAEGQEVIVEATEAAIAQIDAAEQRLVAINEQAEAGAALKASVEELTSSIATLEATNATLTATNATLAAENKKLGEESAADHTATSKKEDEINAQDDAEPHSYSDEEKRLRARNAKKTK